jgi:uncharacterized protein (DUF488 family)
MTTIYTIGHSTRPIEELIDLLGAQQVTQLVDIRRIPRSRHNPQYAQDALRDSLEAAGIAYAYSKALGGLRSSRADSPNTAWRNKSFRNYADYMQTREFQAGVDELVELARSRPTAVMCAEAVPWRCHRSLVADALLVRGLAVRDIISDGTPAEHTLTSFAVVDGTDITYPGTGD